MEKRTLVCHPEAQARTVSGIEIQVEQGADGALWLRYHVNVPINDLFLPEPAEPIREDDLWQTTCFELFVRKQGDPGYVEFNFSPSSKWAAYQFDDFRTGMRNIDVESVPDIGLDASDSHFAAEVELRLPHHLRSVPVAVSLSVVIVENDGRKSLWAVAHPAGHPEFHHADCFALRLAPPAA